MSFILQTERLGLRQLSTADAPFILQLLNTPGWLKFIGDKKVYTLTDAEKYLIDGPIKSYHDNGFGLYLVADKDTGEPIGMCGIIKRDTLDCPDIGYALMPEYIGKGYAYEIAAAVLQYAQRDLQLSALCAITLPINIPSKNLLEKLGFKSQGPFQMAGSTETLLLYRI
ncbi:GNAT family N-acetyltransferase [Mucilaginibacter psychrotolerans]|uniref:N-acetyltransferase n=1 Tax=Mucilaginibacter psychrotolerans TaxID=1524096 RepID=A0A4Y8RY73_9SPHI|nr:GNAT family N-acetyltransferase [Mucilaginibacter psychrotolerans]TFF30380.1 N-acetyltransferase [Mucilaginibacter psychrotolerans]